MWIVGIGVVLVALWFVLAKLRGDAYTRLVATDVAEWLRASGEPDSAIKAFLNSMNVALYVRSSFGKLPASAVANSLIDTYNASADEWRSIGARTP